MTTDERALVARVSWSAMSEPGDIVAGTLVAGLGPVGALEWVVGVGSGRVDRAALASVWPGLSDRSVDRLLERARRWSARRPTDVADLLERARRAGLRVIGPEDASWPVALDDLAAARPHCVWVRGRSGLADRAGGAVGAGARSVALVGSRACTAYGRQVAGELAHGLSRGGVLVISGGAYGIDAAAHRGALAAGGPTLVVLAGGADRAYPAGHAELFEEVVGAGGGLLSESPPGALPMRSRFLQRNRLIAAAAGATVVVEAAWRSGALSTANHAARLLRPVGAVPGPVTSAASAGCHRLMREGQAVCVTETSEVVELVDAVGAGPQPSVLDSPFDELDDVARAVHEALSLRRAVEPDRLAERLGRPAGSVRSALGRLELAGLAARSASGWVATRPPAASCNRPTGQPWEGGETGS